MTEKGKQWLNISQGKKKQSKNKYTNHNQKEETNQKNQKKHKKWNNKQSMHQHDKDDDARDTDVAACPCGDNDA